VRPSPTDFDSEGIGQLLNPAWRWSQRIGLKEQLKRLFSQFATLQITKGTKRRNMFVATTLRFNLIAGTTMKRISNEGE
jgi:hypothetical protein